MGKRRYHLAQHRLQPLQRRTYLLVPSAEPRHADLATETMVGGFTVSGANQGEQPSYVLRVQPRSSGCWTA
jgi:hypothetical protein